MFSRSASLSSYRLHRAVQAGLPVLLAMLTVTTAQAEEAVGGLPAAAEPAPAGAPSRFRYQIGLAAGTGPTFAGSSSMGAGLRPVTMLQWGRFRLSSSQAGLIEGPTDGSRSPGATLSLTDSPRWRSGIGLRFDNGRSAADDARLAGLPDVERTVRGRVYLSYSPEGPADDQRSLGATLGVDLLNRGGGTVLSLDASRSRRLTPLLRWTHGVGVGMADATYLRSYHGVSAESAALTGLPVYRPAAGISDVHAGTGLTWRFDPRWRVGGALNLSWLTGPAAASPLTARRLGVGLVLGVVYISPED